MKSQNPHRKYMLTLYFLTHFTYGMTFNVLGPALPILALQLSQPQQNLIFLVTVRGIAYAIAALLYKKQSIASMDQHILLIGSTSILGISSLVFAMSSNLFVLGVIMFLFALSACSIEIMVNTCVVKLVGAQSKYWVSLLYGVYGLGSIAGPLSVGFFGTYVFSIMGVQMLIICMLYCYLQILRKNAFKSEQILQQLVVKKNQQQETANKVQKQQFQNEQRAVKKQIKNAYLFAGLFYSAMAQSYRVWIPSFCLQTHIGNPQLGTFLVSLHIGFMTIFRFCAVFVSLNNQRILFDSLKTTIFAMGICLGCFLFEFEFQILLLGFFAVLLGMLFSNIFPLILSLPRTYNIQLSASLMSDLMIGTAIGETLMTAFVGYLMFIVHPATLYICVGLFALIVYKVLKYLTFHLQIFSQQELQMQFQQMKQVEPRYDIIIKGAQENHDQGQNKQRASIISSLIFLDTGTNDKNIASRQSGSLSVRPRALTVRSISSNRSFLSNRSALSNCSVTSNVPIQFSEIPRNIKLSFAKQA